MELAIFQIVIPFVMATVDVVKTGKSNLMDHAISRNVTPFVMAMVDWIKIVSLSVNINNKNK